jgi:hypothetical protein
MPGNSAKRVFALDVPDIHVFAELKQEKTWMAGTKPGHDESVSCRWTMF